jgi:hypothetical protein
MLPIRRKFLFSYEGSIPGNSKYSHQIFQTLSNINNDQTDDVVLLNVTCASEGLCGSETSRRHVLSESTFSIIFVDASFSIAEVNQRVFESLQVTLTLVNFSVTTTNCPYQVFSSISLIS